MKGVELGCVCDTLNAASSAAINELWAAEPPNACTHVPWALWSMLAYQQHALMLNSMHWIVPIHRRFKPKSVCACKHEASPCPTWWGDAVSISKLQLLAYPVDSDCPSIQKETGEFGCKICTDHIPPSCVSYMLSCHCKAETHSAMTATFWISIHSHEAREHPKQFSPDCTLDCFQMYAQWLQHSIINLKHHQDQAKHLLVCSGRITTQGS